MKKSLFLNSLGGIKPFFFLLLIIYLLAFPSTKGLAGAIPTTSIVSVIKDTSVVVRTYNMPPNQLFTVRMGAMGTYGVSGIVVGTTHSGSGGSFDATYLIPDALKGSARIAIRMDSPSGYYTYDWFNNGPSAGSQSTGQLYYSGIPTTTIISVVTDQIVTVRHHNFPPNQMFTVRIGPYGTYGYNGSVVATTYSGAGGTFDATYTIPDSMKGNNRLAIRLEAPSIYYAYDWFYNNSNPLLSNGAVGKYSGIPTINIVGVVKGESVLVRTNNFPANQDFTVRMGAIGTKGINGVIVASTNSGAGGVFDVTYEIPPALKEDVQISIRMESSSGYYAYNWFYNN